MYLYKAATGYVGYALAYPAIPTSTRIFICIYIKRKAYTHMLYTLLSERMCAAYARLA
jgi:hypothetical protein